MLFLIFIFSILHYSNNLPFDDIVYVESVTWNAKQWHLVPVPHEIINVTDLSPFFRKEFPENITRNSNITEDENIKRNSWILSPEWESILTETRTSLCKSICLNTYGGIRSKSGNICKCAYIDDNCCLTEDQCFENYCRGDERAEGSNRDKCKFFPLQNRCYSYNYVSST